VTTAKIMLPYKKLLKLVAVMLDVVV